MDFEITHSFDSLSLSWLGLVIGVFLASETPASYFEGGRFLAQLVLQLILGESPPIGLAGTRIPEFLGRWQGNLSKFAKK
ncbi:MAG: hypothetical protein ACK5YR_22555 [Pirellula sp.]